MYLFTRLFAQRQPYFGISMTKTAIMIYHFYERWRNKGGLAHTQDGLFAWNKVVNNIDWGSLHIWIWKETQSFLLMKICQHTLWTRSYKWCHGSTHVYATLQYMQHFFYPLKANILKEFQLPHHDSIGLVLLIPHMVTEAQLPWKKKKGCRVWSFYTGQYVTTLSMQWPKLHQ